MELELDFAGIQDLNAMHTLLKEKFGFIEGYGMNVNALIDCWTSLRYPEDEMTSITVGLEEILNLKVISLPLDNLLIVNNFFIAVRSVNQRYIDTGKLPIISIILL